MYASYGSSPGVYTSVITRIRVIGQIYSYALSAGFSTGVVMRKVGFSDSSV